MENSNFGSNAIYFALGITQSRPAGAFWEDEIGKCVSGAGKCVTTARATDPGTISHDLRPACPEAQGGRCSNISAPGPKAPEAW